MFIISFFSPVTPLSGVCSQQGLVCQLFLMLHLQHKTHSQVSDDVHNSFFLPTNPVKYYQLIVVFLSIFYNTPTEPLLWCQS